MQVLPRTASGWRPEIVRRAARPRRASTRARRLGRLPRSFKLNANRSLAPESPSRERLSGGSEPWRPSRRRDVYAALRAENQRLLRDRDLDVLRRNPASRTPALPCELWRRWGVDRHREPRCAGRFTPAVRPFGSLSVSARTRRASRASSDSRQPVSLSAGDTAAGMPSCTAASSVPPAVSSRRMVIVISPASSGSDVSNSSTSTTSSPGRAGGTPAVGVRAAGRLPPRSGASSVSEMRNVPPSRASNSCTSQVIAAGTFQRTTAAGSTSACRGVDERVVLRARSGEESPDPRRRHIANGGNAPPRPLRAARSREPAPSPSPQTRVQSGRHT